LFDQHSHLLRQSLGLACQADTQPIAYLLTNSGTTNAIDVNIIPSGWTGHEIFLAGLATVKTPRFRETTATEGQLFQSCSVVFEVNPLPSRKHKKAADFSAALCI
jgi:hypothetical protein